MRSLAVLGLVIVVVVVAILGGIFYVVPEWQQVVITQFGKPIGDAITKAGLHVKMPFIQQANYFEKRLMEWDGLPTEIPTKDKKFIWIDETARWRIVDPLVFMQSVATINNALTRLRDIIASATRDIVTDQILYEVVRSTNREFEKSAEVAEQVKQAEELGQVLKGRQKLTRAILARASELTPRYGIELVDMRIKRINYKEGVREKVYQRMIAERKRAAELLRSEGQGKRAEIEGQMEKELKRITSEAYKTAQEVMGKADAEATALYAASYNKDPEFYTFLKTLETYRSTIDPTSTVILTTESDYFKYLKGISGNE